MPELDPSALQVYGLIFGVVSLVAILDLFFPQTEQARNLG